MCHCTPYRLGGTAAVFYHRQCAVRLTDQQVPVTVVVEIAERRSRICSYSSAAEIRADCAPDRIGGRTDVEVAVDAAVTQADEEIEQSVAVLIK